MRYVDADGHVEESLATFDDKYLDPNFRAQRPRVVGVDGLVYWDIDEQLFPRRVGRGCNNLGTPTSYDGKPAIHSAGKPESIGCMELTDLGARLKIMDEEEIAVQVLYSTLFLAYPLSSNPAFVTALCSSYNRWLGDWLSGHERLKWAAVVNLDDVKSAAHEVREVKRLGAAAVMVLGTAGDRQLDDPQLFPFYEAVCDAGLPLAIHVGWACPSINNLYSHIYPSGVVAFHFPVLMGFAALISGGILDRFPKLRAVFLEAGSMWVPYMIDRLNHRFQNQGKDFGQVSASNQADSSFAGDGIHQAGKSFLQRRAGRFYFAAGNGARGGNPGGDGNRHAPRRPRTLRRAPSARAKRLKRLSQGQYPRS